MTSRKLLLVGIDGLRIDDALLPGAAPHLAAFVARGRLHPVTMEVPTISGPGWSSLLTGATHAEHGVFDNSFHGHTLHRNADFLSRAYFADQSRSTFVATSWPPIADPQGPGPIISSRTDQQRIGQHRIVIRDGETYGYRVTDGDVAAAARYAVVNEGPDASFVYLGEVDEAGHLYGGTSAEYAAAVLRVDERLGLILDALAARVERVDEDWLVGVTTDHGHLDSGGHGGAEPVLTRSFLALAHYAGASVDAATTPAPTTTTTPTAENTTEPGHDENATIQPWDVPRILLAHLA